MKSTRTLRKKDKAFPLKIKKGSTTVTVYKTVDRGRERFTLGYHEGARRVLRQFADLEEAKAEAALTAEKLNDGKGSVLELSGAHRDSYLFALSKLNPLGIPLNVAIEEYIAVKQLGFPLKAAVEFYASHHTRKLPDITVETAVAEFLIAKKSDGRSVRYLQDCKVRLERFSKDFKTDLKNIRTADLDKWLRSLKLAPKTRNNFRIIISSLVSFARDCGYLAKGPTEAEATSMATEEEGEIQIFSAEEYTKLLEGADPRHWRHGRFAFC